MQQQCYQFSKYYSVKWLGWFNRWSNLFYSQEEFLLSDYSAKLSKEQRLEEFASFKRLEVYEPPKNLFNSMLGKFIAEIYKISSYGMNLSNFNTLLQIDNLAILFLYIGIV